MKKYRVYALTYGKCFIDIEATSEDEANDIARGTDGGEWTTIDSEDDWSQEDEDTHELSEK